jgi:hypothetical protein
LLKSSAHSPAGLRENWNSPMTGRMRLPFSSMDALSAPSVAPEGLVALPMAGTGVGGGSVAVRLMVGGPVRTPPTQSATGWHVPTGPTQQVPGVGQDPPGGHHCHVAQPASAQQAAMHASGELTFALVRPQHSTPLAFEKDAAEHDGSCAAAGAAQPATHSATAAAVLCMEKRVRADMVGG